MSKFQLNLTRSDLDAIRAVVAVRFDQVVDTAKNSRAGATDRAAAAKHLANLGHLLTILDNPVVVRNTL